MSISIDTGTIHAPTSNTVATFTFAAVADKQHNLPSLAWSYSGTPTGGNLKVENGSGTTVFSIDITSGGPGFFPFSPVLRGSTNTAMIVTLAAGGSGVSGKLNAPTHWTTDA